MNDYAILTDSTCDLPDEILREYGIDLICFKLALDGKSYVERKDFLPGAFCAMLRNAKGQPTTSQITQHEFLERFERYADSGVKEVLYVSINSKGSSTFDSACAAAEGFRAKHCDSSMRIFIVDSRAYSFAQGEPILRASQMLREGASMQSTVRFLEDRYARMEILLTAYSLKIIRKSGRISAAAAVAGDLLGIRPVFTLNDGVSRVVAKIRGDRRIVEAMADLTLSRMAPNAPYHIGFSDRSLYERDYVRVFTERIGYPPETLFDLGAAILANTGPDAVGVVFEGALRAEERPSYCEDPLSD